MPKKRYGPEKIVTKPRQIATVAARDKLNSGASRSASPAASG